MFCAAIESERPNLDSLCSSRLQMVGLKDIVLFLKQESGSKARDSRTQGSKAQGMKNAFRKVSHPLGDLRGKSFKIG